MLSSREEKNNTKTVLLDARKVFWFFLTSASLEGKTMNTLAKKGE